MKIFSQNVIIVLVKRDIEVLPTQKPLRFLTQLNPKTA